MTSIMRDLDSTILERKRKVLPVVIRIRDKIDQQFIRYVGPIGEAICDDAYEDWVVRGSIGPTGLRRYIDAIATEIPNPKKSSEFTKSAISLIRLV